MSNKILLTLIVEYEVEHPRETADVVELAKELVDHARSCGRIEVATLAPIGQIDLK